VGITTDVESGFPSGLFWCYTAKNTTVGLSGTGNVYLVILKVYVTRAFANKDEEQPKGFTERIFLRIIQWKNYKTVKKIFLCVICCLEQLFKYTSLATFGNVFWEFHVIGEL